MARAEITTDKEIRPDQLKQELNGADVFTSEGGVVQAEGVTEDELAAAVEAHVPRPTEAQALAESIKTKLGLSDQELALILGRQV